MWKEFCRRNFLILNSLVLLRNILKTEHMYGLCIARIDFFFVVCVCGCAISVSSMSSCSESNFFLLLRSGQSRQICPMTRPFRLLLLPSFSCKLCSCAVSAILKFATCQELRQFRDEGSTVYTTNISGSMTKLLRCSSLLFEECVYHDPLLCYNHNMYIRVS